MNLSAIVLSLWISGILHCVRVSSAHHCPGGHGQLFQVLLLLLVVLLEAAGILLPVLLAAGILPVLCVLRRVSWVMLRQGYLKVFAISLKVNWHAKKPLPLYLRKNGNRGGGVRLFVCLFISLS